MTRLTIALIALVAAIGCGPSDAEVKAQTTKEWQDRSTVPQGYRDASAAGPPGAAGASGGPPPLSGPVNPPPGR